MKSKYIIGSMAATGVLLVATLASAQVVPAPQGAVNVTTTPSTTGITPGSTNTNFGTIALSGNGGGTYSITSLPITVSPGSGALIGNLSDCQLMNSSGQTLTTGSNTINALASGSNTFMFDTPLQVGSATTTLTVNCNVASGAASGTTFQFVAGTPMLSPGLGVMVNTLPTVPAGTQNAVLGIITLDGTRSGTNANVSSVPVTMTFNEATPNDFTNCALRSPNNLATALNTGVNAISMPSSNGGATSITLDTPFSVPTGSYELLALTCDVSPATPVGSSVTVSLDPATVAATNASTGTTITPAGSFASDGTTLPTAGTVDITAPGTSTGTTGTTVPGVPDTGAGGTAPMTIAFLAVLAALTLGGSALVLKRS